MDRNPSVSTTHLKTTIATVQAGFAMKATHSSPDVLLNKHQQILSKMGDKRVRTLDFKQTGVE